MFFDMRICYRQTENPFVIANGNWSIHFEQSVETIQCWFNSTIFYHSIKRLLQQRAHIEIEYLNWRLQFTFAIIVLNFRNVLVALRLQESTSRKKNNSPIYWKGAFATDGHRQELFRILNIRLFMHDFIGDHLNILYQSLVNMPESMAPHKTRVDRWAIFWKWHNCDKTIMISMLG